MRTRAVWGATALALFLGLGIRNQSSVGQRTAQFKGLTDLFDPQSGVVRDTNGDGLPDSIVGRIIVPASPSTEEIQAAINLAARFGFETTAATLPFVMRENEVQQPGSVALPVLVGRRNTFVQKLVERGVIELKNLKPGQGFVTAVHSPLGGPDGVVVVGADDEGTLAAANELAARLPRLWNAAGITLSGIEQDVLRQLREKGIAAAEAAVDSVLVDADRRGVAAVNIRVQIAPADLTRAVKVFQDVEAAHRRGQEIRTLNYANAAATSVTFYSKTEWLAATAVQRSGMNPRSLTPPIDPDELAADSPGDRGAAGTATPPPPAKSFDLTNPYSIEGWFGDVYADLIPDRTDTSIIIGRSSDGFAAAHLAARLGLESTGITLPLVRTDDKVRQPEREASPILVGRNNELVKNLLKIGKIRFDDLQPGEGAIQIVPKAFGNPTATVVAGADDKGTEAAAMYLARRVPHIWDTRRGAPEFQDVATQASRFLQARSSAGQASQALAELDNVLRGLNGKAIESFDLKLYLEEANPALERFLSERILASGKPGEMQGVKVSTQARNDAVPVFEEKFDIPWEVDDFWARFRADVLPQVKAGARVNLEARLSEPPEVRREIAVKVRSELTAAGALDPEVRVLSAYKQGFLWLTEEVLPQLKGKAVKSINVKVAKYEPDFTKKYKFYMVPTRWLHELYPSDEIFKRELGIPTDAFQLELADSPPDIYSVEAFNQTGQRVFQASFSPKFVEREYLDKFPGWSRVQVTTGWLNASVDNKTVADVRIATDPERFWDYYQSKILPRIYDYVMKTTANRPLPDKQPFHRDLDIEVWMSEPDFSLGIDQELVSSLESLHEDLYFVTLDFFDALGRTTTQRRLAAPGKIFPIIHPSRPRQPGQARILYSGNASAKPKIEISYKEKGVEKPVRIDRELTKIDMSAPAVVRAVVKADRVTEIEVQADAKDDKEASRAADALDALVRLQAAKMYGQALSFEHVDRVAVRVGLKEAQAHSRTVIQSTGTWEPSNVRTSTAEPKLPLVTWDHIISPDESESIIKQLAAFPEVKAYRAGQSYRGRDTSVMEITAPTSSELISRPKYSAYKPTIFITGRQHANEVSSTSHMLRLAELLVTDPSYKEILKKVNVILHPVENPDGAQMAYDLQKLTPTYMLHAGRYSALGMDVASQVGQADPLLPEALVRMKVWRDWLPDIYLNPHGYPSHEWVQQFAGYVPPGFRTYLSTRGWYTTTSGLRDPRYPAQGEVVDAIREAIVTAINSNPDVRDMDLRSQARYKKWAYGFEPYVFNQEIYKDTAIYYSDPETGEPNGSRRAGAGGGGGGDAGGGGGGGGGGRNSMNAWPQVTYFNSGTEAPDEPAQGDWLNLVSKAGFSYLMASVNYLRNGEYKMQRLEEDGQRDTVSQTIVRVRPVMPPKKEPGPPKK
jgi:hypothetical protein